MPSDCEAHKITAGGEERYVLDAIIGEGMKSTKPGDPEEGWEQRWDCWFFVELFFLLLWFYDVLRCFPFFLGWGGGWAMGLMGF